MVLMLVHTNFDRYLLSLIHDFLITLYLLSFIGLSDSCYHFILILYRNSKNNDCIRKLDGTCYQFFYFPSVSKGYPKDINSQVTDINEHNLTISLVAPITSPVIPPKFFLEIYIITRQQIIPITDICNPIILI